MTASTPGPETGDLLPAGPGGWERVVGGQSGATVLRDAVGRRYAKVVTLEQAADLATERDRTSWANAEGIPSPHVLDWRETSSAACLVIEEVPAVPASELDPASLLRAWPSIVAEVRALHAVDPARCPFARDLRWMVSRARDTVRDGRVVTGFLPEHLRHVPPAEVLHGVEDELPLRLAEERASLSVCHGDLCLPNLLVDPNTFRVTAFIDLGRLGTADRHGDLALLLDTAREVWPDEATALRAEGQLVEAYGTELDRDRLGFYLRLDPLTW
jgi:streptomycin 3"-kinase